MLTPNAMYNHVQYVFYHEVQRGDGSRDSNLESTIVITEQETIVNEVWGGRTNRSSFPNSPKNGSIIRSTPKELNPGIET